MARGIKLTRYKVSHAEDFHLHGYRLRVEVTAVNGGMDPAIFLFNRTPLNPRTGLPEDLCLGVVGFGDLSFYPADEPNPALRLSYFLALAAARKSRRRP